MTGPRVQPHCDVCGRELTGRQRTTCSHACQVARSRGQKRGALRETKSCAYCEAEFRPRRSDARYCDACRRTRPWRRTAGAPHETHTALAGPALVDWLETKAPDWRGRLNGQRRTVERWRGGETTPSLWRVDAVFTALGLTTLDLAELPREAWTGEAVKAPEPQYTCAKCREPMIEAARECGFCREEAEARDDNPLAVAA